MVNFINSKKHLFKRLTQALLHHLLIESCTKTLLESSDIHHTSSLQSEWIPQISMCLMIIFTWKLMNIYLFFIQSGKYTLALPSNCSTVHFSISSHGAIGKCRSHMFETKSTLSTHGNNTNLLYKQLYFKDNLNHIGSFGFSLQRCIQQQKYSAMVMLHGHKNELIMFSNRWGTKVIWPFGNQKNVKNSQTHWNLKIE